MSKYHQIYSNIGCLLLIAIFAGCTPFQQYRTELTLCANTTSSKPPDKAPGECGFHAIQKFPAADGADYLLGFIELDDQGQLWDRKQMWSVLDKLSTEAADKDLLIAVFVHGWKHSATPGDNDIETFRGVLAGLSEGELHASQKDPNDRPARQVVGIYLGWRGGSIRVPLIEELTFWDRKNTAQKVSRGGVTEVLSRLELLRRVKHKVAQENGADSSTRLVVVGHSFGGAIVFSSLVQILENRFVHTLSPADAQTDVEGFGNLVVLINPAVEALQFAPLSDMSIERGTYFKTQLPVMAVLTSEADNATRYAFPVGRRLSTLFEKSDRDIKRQNRTSHKEEIIHEDEANITALGHFEPYQTHKLYPSEESLHQKAARISSRERVNSALAARDAWGNDKPGSRISIADLTLERSDTTAGRNPYLVIRVDKSLISGHNNINDDKIIEFLKQFILLSALP